MLPGRAAGATEERGPQTGVMDWSEEAVGLTVPQEALIKVQTRSGFRSGPHQASQGTKANHEAVRMQVTVVVARHADGACGQSGGSCQSRVPRVRVLASQTDVAHLPGQSGLHWAEPSCLAQLPARLRMQRRDRTRPPGSRGFWTKGASNSLSLLSARPPGPQGKGRNGFVCCFLLNSFSWWLPRDSGMFPFSLQ